MRRKIQLPSTALRVVDGTGAVLPFHISSRPLTPPELQAYEDLARMDGWGPSLVALNRSRINVKRPVIVSPRGVLVGKHRLMRGLIHSAERTMWPFVLKLDATLKEWLNIIGDSRGVRFADSTPFGSFPPRRWPAYNAGANSLSPALAADLDMWMFGEQLTTVSGFSSETFMTSEAQFDTITAVGQDQLVIRYCWMELHNYERVVMRPRWMAGIRGITVGFDRGGNDAGGPAGASQYLTWCLSLDERGAAIADLLQVPLNTAMASAPAKPSVRIPTRWRLIGAPVPCIDPATYASALTSKYGFDGVSLTDDCHGGMAYVFGGPEFADGYTLMGEGSYEDAPTSTLTIRGTKTSLRMGGSTLVALAGKDLPAQEKASLSVLSAVLQLYPQERVVPPDPLLRTAAYAVAKDNINWAEEVLLPEGDASTPAMTWKQASDKVGGMKYRSLPLIIERDARSDVIRVAMTTSGSVKSFSFFFSGTPVIPESPEEAWVWARAAAEVTPANALDSMTEVYGPEPGSSAGSAWAADFDEVQYTDFGMRFITDLNASGLAAAEMLLLARQRGPLRNLLTTALVFMHAGKGTFERAQAG